MAGIGFVLRKLSTQKNLSGVFKAFLYSIFISSGPWLFSIIALAIIISLGSKILPFDGIKAFQIIIIYNFSFSFVIYGFFSLVIIRFISDSIYSHKLENITGVMLGSQIVLFLISLPTVYLIYFKNNFPENIALSASINFIILTGVWNISAFLSTLKSYKSISLSFLIGMFFSIIAAFYLGNKYSTLGLINGFTLGLCLILSILFAFVFYEYPFKISQPFKFLAYFRKVWPLAIAGGTYNLAIWIDKWLMWFSPDGMVSKFGLRYDMNYSGAVFLGYLTIIPALGFFLFAIETKFYERILEFYGSINEKGNLNEIMICHNKLLKTLLLSIIDLAVLQSTITVVVILMAHRILVTLNIPTTQLGIFRYSVLSACYILFANFFLIILYYFDNKNHAMYINIVFLISNVILTLISIKLGFAYYGLGLFLASFLTFCLAAVLTISYLKKLPYHTFITKNRNIK